jgi:hypothetical protein
MRIAPGDSIPFWLKIANGNGSRFVVAHVTSLLGVEQVGSPYTLTYTGARGIYTGTGPLMGLTNLVVDYEVYLDSGLTELDKTQLPNLEVMESDISNSTVLSQILGKLTAIDPETIQATLDQSMLTIELDDTMIEALLSSEDNEQGVIEDDTETGTLDTNTLEGDVSCK